MTPRRPGGWRSFFHTELMRIRILQMMMREQFLMEKWLRGK